MVYGMLINAILINLPLTQSTSKTNLYIQIIKLYGLKSTFSQCLYLNIRY